MRQAQVVVAGFAAIIAFAGVAAGCSSDSDNEAADLEAQLEEVTSERDALQAQIDADAARYDKTVALKAELREVLDEPEKFGTEEEVVELLASFATDDAQMYDDAYGAGLDMQQAWYNTLYGGTLDAEIEVVHQWFAPDGSQSSGLWVWRGTNAAGNQFELIGVQVDDHDDDGRITDELVLYPYPDDYVIEAVEGEGTPISGLFGKAPG